MEVTALFLEHTRWTQADHVVRDGRTLEVEARMNKRRYVHLPWNSLICLHPGTKSTDGETRLYTIPIITRLLYSIEFTPSLVRFRDIQGFIHADNLKRQLPLRLPFKSSHCECSAERPKARRTTSSTRAYALGQWNDADKHLANHQYLQWPIVIYKYE
jgi:hypothetical protein